MQTAMLTWISIVGGAALLLLALWDLFWTTLGEGGGPLTRRLAKQIWRLVFALHEVWPKSRLLSIGGIAITLCTVALWLLLSWAGWTLIFSAPGAVVHDTAAGEQADLWGRIYFVGYALSTLGMGDLQPRGDVWRVLTAVASLYGLFQISFAISYLIPLVLAATFKRRIATFISCMGNAADDLLINMWNGEDSSRPSRRGP